MYEKQTYSKYGRDLDSVSGTIANVDQLYSINIQLAVQNILCRMRSGR